MPVVVDTELAITSSPSTTCGRAADSPARKNRLTDRQASTATYSGTPTTAGQARDPEDHRGAQQVGHDEDLPAAPPVEQHAGEGAHERVGQQEHGERPATLAAEVCRSGEKKKTLASADWKAPSAACEVSRVANSRRKSRCRTTARKSPA